MEKFYIVNDANDFGYICPINDKQSKDRYIMFTPHKKLADIFEDESSLDGITNLHEYIIQGKVQKRYVDLDKDSNIIYDELSLYIVACIDTGSIYSEDQFQYHYSVGNLYVNNIKDIDLSKCTCDYKLAEMVENDLLVKHPKILKYHRNNNGSFVWVNVESGLPLEKDIVIDLLDMISSNVKIDNIDKFRLLREELINIMKI